MTQAVPLIKPGCPKRPLSAQSGFSLVEVLMIILLLSSIIIPFTIMMTQTSQLSRGVYLQSTRSLFSANVPDLMDAARPDYYTLFHDSAMETGLIDSGETLPYLLNVDLSKTNTFDKTAYLYFYKTTSDPLASPTSKTTIFKSSNVYRQRCGSADNLEDSSGQEWTGEKVYNAATKQPGYVATGSTTGSTTTVYPYNAFGGNDQALFKTWREGTGSNNIDYNFDVANGDYVVSLYFSEANTLASTSAPNRRLMDIYIEGGVARDTAFNIVDPAAAGRSERIMIRAYDVTVSDSVLNVSVRRNAGSDLDARLNAISIKELLVK